MKRVNTFIPMDSEVMKSKEGIEESSKRTDDELESNKSKKAKSSEKKAEGSRKKSIGKKRVGKEPKQESSKRQRRSVKDDEVAIDAIPLATKPPMIVDYKIDKDGRIGNFKLIRADGSSKSDEDFLMKKLEDSEDEHQV
ncbi:hypothetical protein Tco_0098083 [Tanacetum coccineum]